MNALGLINYDTDSDNESTVETDNPQQQQQSDQLQEVKHNHIAALDNTHNTRSDTIDSVSNDTVTCDPETVDKIRHYISLKEKNNFSLTESIRSKKDFGNPYILQKVVDFYHIDQYGSNYPKEIWDPSAYKKFDFDNGSVQIASQPQQESSDRVIKGSENEGDSAQGFGRKRKSRWDSTEADEQKSISLLSKN
mmetsp:Transcript_22429/g.32712  ORF Transcript_22429/g.32712 Transcript_22429/m.32712 type:complete len:193 (+) Transcript_22429:42-620(+)